jgi:putative membrane protein
MKLLIRILIIALIVMLLSYLLTGVTVNDYTSAIKVAIVLALINFLVKPILVLLTFPITILTLGLFYLVINALMIMLCDNLVDGFQVNSFWTALLFSIILSVLQSVVYKFTNESK